MLHFVAKRLRTPIMSSLLLALFAASSLLLSLSAAYRIHVEKNIQDTVSQFTVIAIANYSAFGSLGGEFIGENNSQAVHYNNRYLALYNLVKRSKNAVLDKRDYLRGTSSRVWPVLASQMDPESFQREEPYVQNHTFVGTCTSISYLTKEEALSLYGAGNMNTPPDLFYKAEFAVEGETLTHPAYSGASTVTVINNRYTSSGEAPFAIGQKYIWIGEYRQPGIIENPAYVKTKEQGVFPSAPPTVPHPEGTSWFKPGLNLSMLPHTLYNTSEYYPTPEFKERVYKGNTYQIPCYPDNWHLHYRKPLNGTLEDFWADNPIWAEWLRTVAEKNMRSLYVLTTDRLGSILYFNQKKAWIQEGREFTEEELSGGSPVCIISETLAKYNQLSVGDVIPLTLYKTSFYIEGDTLHDINYMNDTLLKEETPVTIVGIFSAPKEPFGKKPFSLSFNTVIMPAAFVPVISRAESFPASVTLMENPAYTKDGKLVENLDRAAFDAYWEWQIFLRGMHLAPDLFTAIIENDRMDAFKAEERRAATCGRLACDTTSRHYSRQRPLRNLFCNMQPHGCKCTAFRRSI